MKKKMEVGSKVTKKQIAGVLKGEGSKSQKMKDLFDLGLEVKEIANLMDVRYNFSYNVISNYININEIETEQEEKSEKKQAIIDLFNQGMKKVDISKTLKTNYNYIFKVIKEYKEGQEGQEEQVN